MATHSERSPTDLDAWRARPAVRHDALRGRNGVALGVEPVTRAWAPDAEASDLHRRARLLKANASRSTPTPAA